MQNCGCGLDYPVNYRKGQRAQHSSLKGKLEESEKEIGEGQEGLRSGLEVSRALGARESGNCSVLGLCLHSQARANGYTDRVCSPSAVCALQLPVSTLESYLLR